MSCRIDRALNFSPARASHRVIRIPPRTRTRQPQPLHDPTWTRTRQPHLLHDPTWTRTQQPHLLHDPPWTRTQQPHLLHDPTWTRTQQPHLLHDPPRTRTRQPHPLHRLTRSWNPRLHPPKCRDLVHTSVLLRASRASVFARTCFILWFLPQVTYETSLHTPHNTEIR
jgi:hypothetical protein